MVNAPLVEARVIGVATPSARGELSKEGVRGEAASTGPGQAAHPSPAAAEAAPAAAAFPPLEVAWILALLEWTNSEDMTVTLRATRRTLPNPESAYCAKERGVPPMLTFTHLWRMTHRRASI